ncbi:hypothetical protein [Zestomonas carbonaria]|uniref:Uncharacterized protein n=1 Tax=Zestomonas carbonaria TaxID=2762745 RepID=A0A7U7EMC3_9GAMM|nr:hypothetical protein [Pseudomonas carbonaria]CAD5107077.1 hypothetical protein PSEWESI4_01348 [Pseudomonas carbonaria]
MSTDPDLTLAASLLRRGHNLERTSDGISLLALAYGLAPLAGAPASPTAAFLCGLLLVCGLAQKYWAVRVTLDAELFAMLAKDTEQLAQRTRALDASLGRLGLKPVSADERGWPDRISGALRLLRYQAIFLAAQTILAIAGLLTMPWIHLIG